MENQLDGYFATDKGCALLAAIDAGLIPKTEGGRDVETFEKFWEIYSESSLRNIEKQMEYTNENARKLIEMLNAEREQRADQRNYYIVAQRCTFLAAFLCFLLGGIAAVCF